MPTQNVNLPGPMAAFIQQRVRSGRYQNASEVVRAALRLLEQRESEDELRLQVMRRQIQEGFAALDRGDFTAFTPEQFDGWLKETRHQIQGERESA